MITPYFPEDSKSHYAQYYNEQVGSGLAVFRGATTQRGHGIGSLLGGLVKGALPLLASGAKTFGKELLRTGVDVAGDVLGEKDFKSSAVKNFKEAGSNLLGKLSHTLSASAPKRASKRKRAQRGTKAKRSRKSASLFKNVDVTR